MSKSVSSHLLYDSIHDFKRAAVLVEAEIKLLDIRCDSPDAVQGMPGGKHHDAWASMKAVSHFNLGTALELMLKLLLARSDECVSNHEHHELAKLFDNLEEPDQQRLESKYRALRRKYADFSWFIFNHPGSEPPPPTRNINGLKGFFEYLDQEVVIAMKRYHWEQARDEDWRYYLNDITLIVEFIDRVMNDIPRN